MSKNLILAKSLLKASVDLTDARGWLILAGSALDENFVFGYGGDARPPVDFDTNPNHHHGKSKQAIHAPSHTSNHAKDLEDACRLAGVDKSWAHNKALLEIIQRESNFKTSAQNPTSSGFGIFQVLKKTWEELMPGVPHATQDFKLQAVGGMKYIKKKYHTPERALAFREATVTRDYRKAPKDLQERAKQWIAKNYIGY